MKNSYESQIATLKKDYETEIARMTKQHDDEMANANAVLSKKLTDTVAEMKN